MPNLPNRLDGDCEVVKNCTVMVAIKFTERRLGTVCSEFCGHHYSYMAYKECGQQSDKWDQVVSIRSNGRFLGWESGTDFMLE